MSKNRNKTMIMTLVLAVFTLILISGCGMSDDPREETGEFLKNDALISLKSAYGEEYTRLTIIRGALNKYIVNPANAKHLGTVMGAVEATVFPEEYELKRFTQLENLPAEMRKDIISQPMLDITYRTRGVLNHIYTAVLKPLSEHIDRGGQINTAQLQVITNLMNLLETLARDYSLLANTENDFNSTEMNRAFISIQNNLNEMQKLELVEIKEQINK